MKKIMTTTAIVLISATLAFAAGTRSVKPVEDLNRSLDDFLSYGTNTDGIDETDMKPSQVLIDKLNLAVVNSTHFMTKQDCIAGTDKKPSQQLTQDLAGTLTKSDVKCQ